MVSVVFSLLRLVRFSSNVINIYMCSMVQGDLWTWFLEHVGWFRY